jgi:hypothetical protein
MAPNNDPAFNNYNLSSTHKPLRTPRKSVIRQFLLSNPFAPLVFRFLNLSITSTTLAIATRIWVIQKQNHVEGIIGRSPLLAIIFAPLTLVHVVTNVYVSYHLYPS